MERTVTFAILFALTIVAAAIIILFVVSMKEELRNGMCDPDPACGGRSNGETFCDGSTALNRCVLIDGCLRTTRQDCTCATVDGIAACS